MVIGFFIFSFMNFPLNQDVCVCVCICVCVSKCLLKKFDFILNMILIFWEMEPTQDHGGYCSICCFSVTKLGPSFCYSMDCSTPGLPAHHPPEFAQVCVHWISDAIQTSHPVTPFSSCPQYFPASRSFPMSQLFASGGQSIGVSASASVLSMSTQGWFPLRLTGLILLFTTLLKVLCSIYIYIYIYG